MVYISSDKISVFPCGNRSDAYPNAKLTTEFNLTNIINKLINVESFVINKEYKTNNIVNDLEFNIKGYYFKLDSSAVTTLVSQFSSSHSIYAIIKITDVESGDYSFKELQNIADGSGHTLDVGSEFQGLKFDSASSSNTNEYSLKVLEKSGSTWIIPEGSKIRFKSIANDNSRLIIVDDGELD